MKRGLEMIAYAWFLECPRDRFPDLIHSALSGIENDHWEYSFYDKYKPAVHEWSFGTPPDAAVVTAALEEESSATVVLQLTSYVQAFDAAERAADQLQEHGATLIEHVCNL